MTLRRGALSGCVRLACAFVLLFPACGRAQTAEVRNAAGVAMAVDPTERDPALLVTVPDGAPDHRSFKILLPEHVTVRPHGQAEARHLYIHGHDEAGIGPHWRSSGSALEYTADLGEIRFTARATLADDGILFHYSFMSSGATDYDMVTAVTDPRFSAVFYDPRLQRTYVHRGAGFALIAAATPERLTMPLAEWFPVRYLAAYTIPVPAKLAETRDGITYRYSPERVDEPAIYTLSEDGAWVAASFSRDPGNVWTNPQLTCQHVDPQVPLPHGGHAGYEMKILIVKGGLEDARAKVSAQVGQLR